MTPAGIEPAILITRRKNESKTTTPITARFFYRCPKRRSCHWMLRGMQAAVFGAARPCIWCFHINAYPANVENKVSSK